MPIAEGDNHIKKVRTGLGQAEFLLRRHARAIGALKRQWLVKRPFCQKGQKNKSTKKKTHSESPRTPRRPTPDLLEVRQRRKRRGVTQRHVDQSVVRKGAHGRQRRALLSAALGGRRDEEADVLAVEPASLPLLAGLIPEGLPLGWEVAETGWDAEEEGIVFLELIGGDERDGGRLAGCVHFLEDFLGKGLFDSIKKKKEVIFQCFLHRTLNKASSGPRHYALEWEWVPTGRGQPYHRRLQYRLSLPRQAWQCGRTWNTISIESVECLEAASVALISRE